MADLIVPAHTRRIADRRLALPKSCRPKPIRCRDCGQDVPTAEVVALVLPSGRAHGAHVGCPRGVR